ncbi:hypothetical protein BDB00DRAFT_927803 [Zychaea mexicana]|uniref:uncharacterized protein n=1 Tax=Zychaea mexicana TaxID=64656 RepID=UPI0022FEDC5E|nr:uncharacterized protein BDB00DRAFT_927803 [Zychaea mexicana]KAI9495128.1 hypothetical protein BDB00DRAFT_927803 [Zychaea mexicana]
MVDLSSLISFPAVNNLLPLSLTENITDGGGQVIDRCFKILLAPENRKKFWIGTAVIYLALVRYFRFRSINQLKRKYPDPTLPLRDLEAAEEVFSALTRREFPFLSRTSLELALFRTYAVPTISNILHSTGQFDKETLKRAEDTGLILAETLDAYAHIEELKRKNPDGVVSQEEIEEQRRRPDIAITRLNEIHGKYPIKNGDYVYTLSLFIIEPIKWINKHGWRKLEPLEINAIFRVWYDVGIKMNIKNIPETVEAMFEFNEEYAQENVYYAPSNWKVGKPTVDLLLRRFPSFAKSIAYTVIPAVLEPLDIKGFGLQPSSPMVVRMIGYTLYVRSFIVRYLMLPRIKAVLRTPVKPDPQTNRYKPLVDLYDEPAYPNGYCIYELGPTKYMPTKCPVPH